MHIIKTSILCLTNKFLFETKIILETSTARSIVKSKETSTKQKRFTHKTYL